MLINAAQIPFLYKIEADSKCTKEDLKVRRSGMWYNYPGAPCIYVFRTLNLGSSQRAGPPAVPGLTPGGILTVTAYLSIRKMLARIR